MNKITISDIEKDLVSIGEYKISGWIKTHRRSKNISFIELTDGSMVKGLQLVIEPALESYSAIADSLHTGAAISLNGKLCESPAKGQKYEFQVADISLVGYADPETYILQKKKHTLDTLRENIHIRPRSNTIGAVMRLRSDLSFAVHEFFRKRQFIHIHTPIITTSDCEGAGEMFRVTSLDLNKLPIEKGQVDFRQDFFSEPAHLTVSGQLEAEIFAQALSRVYTFGPTFRAENSNTTRHLSEFWMIEPEMAFCDLEGDMQVAKDFIQELVQFAFENSAADLDFLHAREWVDSDLRSNLETVLKKPAEVLDYTEAIKILETTSEKFEFTVQWGMDLQAEHEKFLTEKHIKGPVFIINYPKNIKPFYMRDNDDGKTVAAMDLLVPGVGEIIGGSQREEREEILQAKMQAMGLDKSYNWYLDLRKYGTTPHAGFGLGFERLIMYISGIKNIRDVMPVPRYPGHGGVLGGRHSIF